MVCKTVIPGSIPGAASIRLRCIINTATPRQGLRTKCYGEMFSYSLNKKFGCRDGGIGRRKGLKIPRANARAGSSPALGTNLRS